MWGRGSEPPALRRKCPPGGVLRSPRDCQPEESYQHDDKEPGLERAGPATGSPYLLPTPAPRSPPDEITNSTPQNRLTAFIKHSPRGQKWGGALKMTHCRAPKSGNQLLLGGIVNATKAFFLEESE